MTQDSKSTEHLSAELISAYLDGVLTGAEKDSANRHLAMCDECRAELVAVRKVLGTRRTPRGWIGLGLVAAAALLIVMTVPIGRGARVCALAARVAVSGRSESSVSPPAAGGSTGSSCSRCRITAPDR